MNSTSSSLSNFLKLFSVLYLLTGLLLASFPVVIPAIFFLSGQWTGHPVSSFTSSNPLPLILVSLSFFFAALTLYVLHRFSRQEGQNIIIKLFFWGMGMVAAIVWLGYSCILFLSLLFSTHPR